MTRALESIAAQRIIPVLRCAKPGDAVETSRACARAGMRVVELTCTTADVESAIAALAAEGLVVGLGTIATSARIAPAVRAGASFVVSYCAPAGFVATAHACGVTAIPGALSPGEVAACRGAGADAIKLFPAERLSPAYLRQLSAVMPGLSLMPTGGIRPVADDVRPWLDAGAIAVGIGSGLGTVSEVGAERVELNARRVLDAAAGV